uniref:Uncharacterized protein n=1 Tax=Pediastrum duplex TaxID=3105 RepID=A0A2U8GI61_PEDDU|nr:hypothetical protein [Pediastrum duplex]
MRVFASSSFVSVRSSPSLRFAKRRADARRRSEGFFRFFGFGSQSEEPKNRSKRLCNQRKKPSAMRLGRASVALPLRKRFGEAEEAHRGAPRRTEAPSEDARLRKQRYEEAKQKMCRNTSRRSEAKTKEQNKRKLITSWFCEANFELKIPKAQ